MSGKMNSPADAIMLAAEVVDNGALTSLDISSNANALVGFNLPEGWSKDEDWFSGPKGQCEKYPPAEAEVILDGIIALANAIPDIGALIKLDISSNNIGGEQEGELQRICVASGIELAK
jgi:hypothetical protein